MSKQQHGRLTIFQAAAVDDARLGSAAFRVLACLGTYSDKDGWAWPSQTTIATRLGISRQAVNKSIQQLAELGYLVIHHQYGDDGGMRAARYRLCLDMPAEDDVPLQSDIAPLQRDVAPPVNPTLHPLQRQKLHPLQRDVAQNVSTLTTHKNDPKERKSGGAARPARLTLDSYVPADELLDGLAEERPDLNLTTVIENWRDYHRERGTAIKDYNASLRRWVRGEKPPPRAPTVRAAHTNGYSSDDAFAKNMARLKAVGRQ